MISDNSKFVACGVTGVWNTLLGQNSTSSTRLETTTILIYSTDIIKQCGIYFWPQLAQVPFLPFKDFSRDIFLCESCVRVGSKLTINYNEKFLLRSSSCITLVIRLENNGFIMVKIEGIRGSKKDLLDTSRCRDI